jgi:hypothetical protein
MVTEDSMNEPLWKDKRGIKHPAHDTTPPDEKKLGG